MQSYIITEKELYSANTLNYKKTTKSIRNILMSKKSPYKVCYSTVFFLEEEAAKDSLKQYELNQTYNSKIEEEKQRREAEEELRHINNLYTTNILDKIAEQSQLEEYLQRKGMNPNEMGGYLQRRGIHL